MPAITSVRAARQSHEARIRFWRVLIVTSFFVVMLGAYLFIGAVVMFGNNNKTQLTVTEATAAGKTTRIARPMLDGTFCRSTVYDNTSAETLEDKVERCDASRPKPKIKPRGEFTWGGK